MEKGNCIERPDLISNQEEADTRLILHGIAAADEGANIIVVRSPDTDVLVLLLHHRPAIHAEEIYFLTGHEGVHSNSTRYIPVHILYKQLTPLQHNIMIDVYALTGCDTTLSFHGHGKITAFNIMVKKAEEFQALSGLGLGPVSQEQVVAFVGAMYGSSWMCIIK